MKSRIIAVGLIAILAVGFSVWSLPNEILEPVEPTLGAATIAFDNAVTNGINSATLASYTVTAPAGDGMLICFNLGDISADNQTGVTYNGVAMNFVNKKKATGDRWMYAYALGNLSTQTGNVVVSGNTFNGIFCTSYTGVSAVIDNSNNQEHSGVGNFTSSTFSITPVASNAWVVLFTYWNTATAGAGATQRATSIFSSTMFDSNAAVTGGVQYDMTVTTPSDNYLAAIQLSLAPAAGAVASPTNEQVTYFE